MFACVYTPVYQHAYPTFPIYIQEQAKDRKKPSVLNVLAAAGGIIAAPNEKQLYD